MSAKCPACNRAIRKKPERQETPEETHKRIMAKARASISANLRKPMPLKTTYKGD